MLACNGMQLTKRPKLQLDGLFGKWYIFAKIWCYV